MLGELYQPKGLARETAQAVLECDNPYAVNVAWGCENCEYCYNRRRTGGKITHPKKPVVDLVLKQLESGIEPKGVFISFGCEPLMKEGFAETWAVIRLLRGWNIRVAVLSKMGVIEIPDFEIRHGATLVSLSKSFSHIYESGAAPPIYRLNKLIEMSEAGAFTWVSVEPYPPPAIYEQDLQELLNELTFVDFLIFGRWNYDKRANTPESKEFYKEAAVEFVDFCKAHGIRYHVKSDTGGMI